MTTPRPDPLTALRERLQERVREAAAARARLLEVERVVLQARQESARRRALVP